MNNLKLLIVGTVNNFCLETSYASSAKELNCEVVRFNPAQEIIKHIRFGVIGKVIYDFLNVEIWTRKMNRELIIRAKQEKPDVFLVVGGSKIYYGALTTIKVILPGCKVVWIWPDTPMNLSANNLNCARVFDLSATYSKATVKVFESLGFNNVHWIPLAGDLALHWNEGNEVNGSENFDCDISFVGMWRPERERFMRVINENFGHLKVEIYGSYWKRNCRTKELMKKWMGTGFYGKALSNHFSKCRVNVNIIDDTNYPAANMRFFEIPTSGGLQLCSACPEFEEEFIDKRDILYFKNASELVEKINWILSHDQEAREIRRTAQLKIKQTHNYTVRLQKILSLISSSEQL